MAQPFGVGDVVGGRYRITHHVVTSADQDIVFQGMDQVLDREVNILLAATSNAKQVATSARELAAGERESGVQVLDLGLAGDRTYLISSLIDPNQLLDLVVPDTAPYVEPFFTDSLGSELFGQSRIMEPETYQDDPEYYARLHGLSPTEDDDDAGSRYRRKRPAFLDKVSDSLNKRLGTEKDAERIAAPPTASAAAPGAAASEASGSADAETEAGQADGVHPDAPEGTSPEGAAPEPGAAADDAAAERAQPGQRAAGQRRRPSVPFPIPMPGAALSGTQAETGDRPRSLRIPSALADLQLVESTSSADTAEEFGAQADELGSYRPIGQPDLGTAADDETVGAVREHQRTRSTRGETVTPSSAPVSAAEHAAEGEEVVDDPPSGPVPAYDRRPEPEQAASPEPAPSDPAAGGDGTATEPRPDGGGAHQQQPDSFTGLITAVPDGTRRAFPAAAAGAGSTAPPTTDADDVAFTHQRPGPGRWVSAVLLGGLILAAAVAAFLLLGSAS